MLQGITRDRVAKLRSKREGWNEQTGGDAKCRSSPLTTPGPRLGSITPAKDLEASNSFYGTLFGWEADDQGEDMGHYTLMRKGGKSVAGNMTAMSAEQPSVWVTYVAVDDADATVELAKKAGATVFVEPMDVSDIGRMAVFADPRARRSASGNRRPSRELILATSRALRWNELNT